MPDLKHYRVLSAKEIELINRVKDMADKVGELIESIERIGIPENDLEGMDVDGRWLAIGRTQLQQGFMAVVRSVAQPTGF